MENSIRSVDEAEIGYARQRLKNRVFTQLATFFEEEAESRGITKRDLADALQKDPGQLTRLLRHPSNLTLETISDLLVALEAEMETRIVRFADRAPSNYMHPLLAALKADAGPTVEFAAPAIKPKKPTQSSTTPSPAKVEVRESA